ncbi:hypothetical protein BY996DRAFT_4585506 [Phakopsora pachyrhizi]|nr:hypothetical protein BY996DRAFT_4585506 [Phakopsora pachyrhizi]
MNDTVTRTRVHLSLVVGHIGPYIPFRNHSFLCYLGPKVWILLLDCRSERMKERVCSPETYGFIFEECKSLPGKVKHLIVLVGIPVRLN